MAEERVVAKEKDTEQIVRYLTSTFNTLRPKIGRAFRGKKGGPNRAYVLETDFAYLINEVMVGPRCMLQKNIADCNDFLDSVVTEVAQRAAKQSEEDELR